MLTFPIEDHGRGSAQAPRASGRGLSHSAKARILRLAARWNAMADDAEHIAAVIGGAAIAATNKTQRRD
jgi:hypothetical protein